MENNNSFYAQKKITITTIISKIEKLQPIEPKVLKASITVEEPFLSDKMAEYYIMSLFTLGKIIYNKEKKICLSK